MAGKEKAAPSEHSSLPAHPGAGEPVSGESPEPPDRARDEPQALAPAIIVDPITCYAGSLRRALFRASGDAHARGEVYAVEHLFRALLDEHEVRRALDHIGIDRYRLIARVGGYLAATSSERRALAAEGVEERGVHDLLWRCIMHGVSAEDLPVSGAHVLVQLLDGGPEPSHAARFLSDAGVTPLALKRYVAHGPRAGWRRAGGWSRVLDLGRSRAGSAHRSSAAEHGPRNEYRAIPVTEVEVIAHNDPYTTREFVVEIIERQFAKSRAEATEIMLAVHRRGASLIAVVTPQVAEEKIAEIHEQAAVRGYPLRLSVREHRSHRGHWLRFMWFRVGRWLAQGRG